MAVIKGVVLHPALVCSDVVVEKGSMWIAASHSELAVLLAPLGPRDKLPVAKLVIM